MNTLIIHETVTSVKCFYAKKIKKRAIVRTRFFLK